MKVLLNAPMNNNIQIYNVLLPFPFDHGFDYAAPVDMGVKAGDYVWVPGIGEVGAALRESTSSDMPTLSPSVEFFLYRGQSSCVCRTADPAALRARCESLFPRE